MSGNDSERGPFSLKRWSQRKLAAARAATPDPGPGPAPERSPSPPFAMAPTVPANARPLPAGAESSAPPGSAGEPQANALPPVESLTLASDFTPFLQPQVAETLRRQALRQLFRDPHFNAMDGLDVYIDDYTRPDPLSPELARQLVQARYVLDPPATRVNAEGFVEDVPREAKVAGEQSANDPAPAGPDASSADAATASAASPDATGPDAASANDAMPANGPADSGTPS